MISTRTIPHANTYNMDTHTIHHKKPSQPPHTVNPFISIPIFLALGIALRASIPESQILIIYFLGFALGLLLISHTRPLAIWLLIFTLGLYRADQSYPIPEQTYHCTGIWQLRSFPMPNEPFGERLPLTYIEGNCPTLIGKTITLYRYSHQHAILGDTYPLTLTIKSGSKQYYAHTNATTETIHAPIPFTVKTRRWLHNRIQQTFPQSANWIDALITGNRSGLTTDDRQMLQTTGTAHLLAISGLHLAIVIGLCFFATRYLVSLIPFLRSRVSPQSYAYLISLSIGLLFALISGGQTPILRAWLMFACLTLSWFYPSARRHYALPLALILILYFDPSALMQLGAWLSFIATATVIIAYRRTRHLKNATLLWTTIQLITTLTLTPLIWSAFGGIPVLSLPLNLIIIPWLAPLLLLVFFTLLCPTFSTLTEKAFQSYLYTIEYTAEIPHHYLTPIYQPSIIAGTLWSITLLCLLAKTRKKLTIIFAIASVIALLTPFVTTPTDHSPSSKIHFINRKNTFIINTGKRTASEVRTHIIPQLRQRAINPRAILITSTEQTGGLEYLHQHYPTTPIYTTIPLPTLAIPHQYCPTKTTSPHLTFTRHQHCQWQITR